MQFFRDACDLSSDEWRAHCYIVIYAQAGGVSVSRQNMTALSAKRMGRLQSPVIFIAVAGRIITMAMTTGACKSSLCQTDAASRPTGGVSTIKSRKKFEITEENSK